MLRLGERGHGHADRALARRQPPDVGGFRRLHVGPEPDAELGGPADHPVAVALEPVEVEKQRRGGKIVHQQGSGDLAVRCYNRSGHGVSVAGTSESAGSNCVFISQPETVVRVIVAAAVAAHPAVA
jgi:hypothetical protein